jgi:PAS domain S-box-containing protein
MKNENKTKEQLINEVREMRQRVTELETSEKEHKRAEEELRTQRGKFEGIIASLADGLDIVSRDYRVHFQNKMLRDRFGDLTGKLCYEEYMAREIPCEPCPMVKAIATGSTQRVELTGADGREYEVTSTPFQDVDGETKVIEVVRDITERKRAEEEIRRLKEFNEGIVQGVAEALLIEDATGIITFVNPALELLLGYTADELVGRHWQTIVPKEEVEQVQQKASRRPSGVSEQYETRLLAADDTEISVIVSARPLFERGIFTGVLSAFTDITKRKRAEERLEHLNLVLRAIRRVNQLITRERDRDRLLQGACDALIETRGYYNAWIALLDEAGGLVTTAEAGLGEAFLPMVEWLKRGELTACRQRLSQLGVVVTKDPPSACADCPLSASYRGRGAITARLEYGGKVYGLLSASIPAHLTADGEEQVLFEEVSRDIAFALHGIELEEERKRAEEALQESEKQFRELVENANDIIYTHDLEGNFTSVNPAVTRIYGYTTEEALQLNIAQIVDPEYLPLARQKIREKLEDVPRTGPYELLTYSKEGEPIWVEVSTRLLEREGQPIGVLGIARDITERKRAEEALRESEERYRSVVENSHAGILIVDDAYRFTYVNEELCEILGRSREEIIGQDFRKFLDDESRELVADRYVRRQRGEEVPPRYEFNVVRKDGEKRRAEISSAVIRDSAGKVKTVAQILDITERKRAEEELRQSYVKLRRTLEGTVHALVSAIEMRDPYTAGHQRRVTLLACAIAKEMGLAEEQVEGIRMAGLIHDLGKINVPAEILSKPAQLTELEYGLIKMHPQIGHDVLNTIDFPWPLAQIVLQHHERMDGSGYPQGLSGEDILLEARILGVADVVEAMASHRPYRSARGIDEALEEISANRGIFYDPEVVDTCVKLFTEKGFKFE